MKIFRIQIKLVEKCFWIRIRHIPVVWGTVIMLTLTVALGLIIICLNVMHCIMSSSTVIWRSLNHSFKKKSYNNFT